MDEVKNEESLKGKSEVEGREEAKTVEESTSPKIDLVIEKLSAYSANQSYYALAGILGWASHEAGLLNENDFTAFARAVMSQYKPVIDRRDFSELNKYLYDDKKRTELTLGFLFAIKKEYRNAWMQILLQSIGCCEIAGRTFKIQQELHKADPSITNGLREAFLESVKPELKDDALAIVESVASIITAMANKQKIRYG